MSTLVVAGISLAVGVLFSSRVDDLTRVVNFGALCGFVLLHVSVIHHYFLRQRSGKWLQHLLLPVTGLLIIGFVLYEMDPAAKKLGAVWVLIGGIYYAILTLRGASVPIGGVPPG